MSTFYCYTLNYATLLLTISSSLDITYSLRNKLALSVLPRLLARNWPGLLHYEYCALLNVMFMLSHIDNNYALLPYSDGRPFFHGPCDLLRLRQTTNKAR